MAITSLSPAGPPAHPVLGHLAELRRDWLGTLTRYAREYGDFVPLRIGPKRAFLICHPDYVEDVLVTNYRSFVKSPSVRNGRRLLGNGLVTSEGEFWRRQRRLVQPAFHRPRLATYGVVMVGHAERMLGTWRDGQERDVHTDMMSLTLQIVARTLFDADVGDETGEVSVALQVALERFSARLESLLFLVPDTLPLPGNLAFLRAADKLDRLIYRLIEARRAQHDDRGDLLSMLLQIQDEDGSRMSDRQLRDEVMTLFLAGHETTAVALSWTWYLLSQHPAVEQKLLSELNAVLGGRAPTVADLPRLPYTEHVVSEAMRVYPPVWGFGREAIQDCRVGEYTVKRGSIVVMSQWVQHHDPRFFERPDVFEPDRWADGLAKRLPRLAYFPFGGGPRQCIGNAFAMMEATLLLATIAQQFQLALKPGHVVALWPSLTLRPKHGVRVVLRRR